MNAIFEVLGWSVADSGQLLDVTDSASASRTMTMTNDTVFSLSADLLYYLTILKFSNAIVSKQNRQYHQNQQPSKQEGYCRVKVRL